MPPPRRDAAAGRDGSADTGTGGTGGSRDAAADASTGADRAVDRTPDAGSTDAAVDSPVDSPVTPDAPPDTMTADSAPPDTAPPDTTPDTTPDTAPPDTAPADTAPPSDGPVVVDECHEINCPGLLQVTDQCPGDNVACVARNVVVTPETDHICLMNGVKKRSTATDNGFIIEVNRAGGAACYTLEIDTPATGPELWIFKAPGGAELARVSLDSTTVPNRAILTCAANGLVYDVTVAGCDGMEGEGDGCGPDTANTCTTFP